MDIQSLSGIEFEHICKDLLEKMGFTVELTQASRDGGIDLIASNSTPILSGRYIVQCKRYTNSVGEPVVRDLYGVITSERANKGIIITTGTFTQSAYDFATGKQIELIDGTKLSELLETYSISNRNVESFQPIIEIMIRVWGEECKKFYYDEPMKNLAHNPHDIKSRLTLIDNFTDMLRNDFGSRLTPRWFQKKADDEHNVINEIFKNIDLVHKELDRKTKEQKYLDDILILHKINFLIYKGEFANALKTYKEILSYPELEAQKTLSKDLQTEKHLQLTLFMVAFNMVQISNYSKKSSFFRKINELVYNKTKALFEYRKNFNRNVLTYSYSSPYAGYHKHLAEEELNRINNIKEAHGLYYFEKNYFQNLYETLFYNTESSPGWEGDFYITSLNDNTFSAFQYTATRDHRIGWVLFEISDFQAKIEEFEKNI